MPTELIDVLLRVNLALAASVLLVLALRVPVRRYCGARIAYALWLLPLAAMAMCFVPGRIEHVMLEAPMPGAAHPGIIEAPATEHPYLLWAWCVGVLLSLAVLALRQARFTSALGTLSLRGDLGARVRTAESATHGPAVLGVLRPIIVTPSDFESRFDAEERRIVLAHENAHLAQGDPLINAAVVLLQCVNWFNPFVHLGARALRLDQELACDAAVLAQSDGMRRRYAEAMLKTHIAAAAPLGCAWPPSNLNALKERISMLKLALPTRTQRLVGASVIALAAAGAAAASWAAQPAQVVTTFAPVMAAAHAAETSAAASADDLLAGFDEDGDGRVRIMRDGVLVEERDLTPEEREELRESLAEAREAMAEARVAMDEARLERLDALRDLEGLRDLEHLHALEGLAALEALRDIDVEVDQEEIRRAAREARLEARHAARLSAEERREIEQSAREAMREAEIELAMARREERIEAREAIREARMEVTEELRQARARGDQIEIDALEIAERTLRQIDEAAADER